MERAGRSSSLTAVIAAAVACRLVTRRCAVTSTSSSMPAAASGGAACECAMPAASVAIATVVSPSTRFRTSCVHSASPCLSISKSAYSFIPDWRSKLARSK